MQPEPHKQLIDPRAGDFEDDAASPRHRSLWAIAGSMLVEINLLKLALALIIMIFLPAVVLGLAPLLVTGWFSLLSSQFAEFVSEIAPFLSLVVLLAIAYVGGRPMWRALERSFWSLISLLVQPGYAIFREGLRHLGERIVPQKVSPARRARLAQVATAFAGLLLCVLALWAVYETWPATRWSGNLADLRYPQRLIGPTLANSFFIVGLFMAAASLFWCLADAAMEHPIDLEAFDADAGGGKVMRIAHLSDLHMVGGPYEFRLESGRAGPQGNEKVRRALEALDAAHRAEPVDLVLVSGDVTDCGRSIEWAAFLELISAYPALFARTVFLPGNHDLNVVDRSNPARLELPTGAGKCLREMRALSALEKLQGERVRVMDRKEKRFSLTLSQALAEHRGTIRDFADRGGFSNALALGRLWDDLFPMIVPPDKEGGIGVILLNSNAETHFSFTNALGLVPAAQAKDLLAATTEFPGACWIVGLHHHLMEYPKAGSTLAARIGTALINGSWFMRELRPLGRRVVAMHGHRHIDWIGQCGDTRIVSAPSPVMSHGSTHFYIHRMARRKDGALALLEPQKVDAIQAVEITSDAA